MATLRTSPRMEIPLVIIYYGEMKSKASDLYTSALIHDWNQLSALDIIQKLSILSPFDFVIFVSVSKLFKNVNLQSYMITKNSRDNKKWLFRKG